MDFDELYNWFFTPSKPNSGIKLGNKFRWFPDIQKFKILDKIQNPPKKGILFTGSSSIRKWKYLKDYFPIHKNKIINRGFGGSWFQDLLTYFEDLILNYDPRILIIYSGDNDHSGGNKTSNEILEDFKNLISKIHLFLPQTKIIIISIKPSIKRWHLWPQMKKTNKLIKNYSETQDFIDFADIAGPMLKLGKPPPKNLFLDDLLHPSKEGYKIWAKEIQKFL